MKILHYIDCFHPIRLPKEYFELLAREGGEETEIHLLMPKPDEEVKVEGVQVHYLSYFTWMRWRNKRRFIKVMNEVNPDIINIHSCWSQVMSGIVDWNEKYYKRPLILSTHKQLMPWHNPNKIKRYIQTQLYQQKILRKADVILTDSRQETNIQANPHIFCIPNALLTKDFSGKEMQSEYTNLCISLSNSNPYLFMTEKERRKEASLLKEAVMQKRGDSQQANEDEMDESYERIILHAQYEGTLKMLLPFLPNGAKEYADNTPHYIYNTKKNVDSLFSLKALSKKSDLVSFGKEEAATENELLIAKYLLNVKYEIVHNTVSQRHLIELYKALKTIDYDEDTLNALLMRLGTYQDTARMMQLLKDYYNLEEGFMPMEPIDDKITKKIKDKLLLWQIQA
ncbi:MAG: glycosyltransferase [Bacteroidaceae bacterium]|nr:glycosyltransferase [Bacteroidaceae bacterium]